MGAPRWTPRGGNGDGGAWTNRSLIKEGPGIRYKGFRAGGEGGARREALRFCTGFVDSSPIIFTHWTYTHWTEG